MRRALIVLLAVAASTAAASASARDPITGVATTTQLQDLVRNVGGSHVKLVGILRPNVDPHDYEPTPGDATAISGARLIVVSGVGLDAWTDKLIANAGSGAPVLVASHGLKLRK